MSKIDEMVNRFLAWKLPQDFSPDAGITFVPPTENAGEHFWPTGTNLLTATQVKVMLEHVVGERLALLEKVAVHAQFYLNGLPDADGYELGEALRAAGYLEEWK